MAKTISSLLKEGYKSQAVRDRPDMPLQNESDKRLTIDDIILGLWCHLLSETISGLFPERFNSLTVK